MNTDQHQADWVGYEKPVLYSSFCLTCRKGMPRFYDARGRVPEYCSDSCKMKAYRERKKVLRNSAAAQQTLTFVQSSRSDGKHLWFSELNGHKFMIMFRNRTNEYFVGYQKPAPFDYVAIDSSLNRTRFYKFDDAVKAANDYYQSLTQARDLSSEGTTGLSSERNALDALKSVESASNTHTKGLYPVLNTNKGA